MGEPSRHPLRNAILTWTLERLAARLGRRSWAQAQRFGRRLGRLAWQVSRRDRRRTLDHLAIAFPELPETARAELAKRCFEHYGLMLGEALHLLAADCETLARHVRIEGFDGVEAAREAGLTPIVISGHCGNWELLPAAVNCRGLGMKVVVRTLDDSGLQRLLGGFRARFGTGTIERGSSSAPRQLLHALREGALGFMIDQDTKVDGVWVPFFGKPAYTPSAAAKLGRRDGVAVFPAFIERQSDGSHVVRFQPRIELPEDLTAATALLTERIEEQIRRAPEQWVWMHRRWRRQPEGA